MEAYEPKSKTLLSAAASIWTSHVCAFDCFLKYSKSSAKHKETGSFFQTPDTPATYRMICHPVQVLVLQQMNARKHWRLANEALVFLSTYYSNIMPETKLLLQLLLYKVYAR